MSRKKKKQEVVTMQPSTEVGFETEPMFETEAYTAPQPDAGADVTVMKPVGTGGPVPIVAPKHGTIQLQPIVVPLAVVPYMTQDSSVLRTDARAQGNASADVDDEATDFEAIEAKKLKKQRASRPRIFGLVTLLVSVVALLPFILSLFMDEVYGIDLTSFNLKTIIENWIADGFAWRPLHNLGYVCIAGVNAICALFALLTIVFGKYPRLLNILLTLASTVALVVYLVLLIVRAQFVVADSVAYLVVLGASALNSVLAIVFTILMNKLDDKSENSQLSAMEI